MCVVVLQRKALDDNFLSLLTSSISVESNCKLLKRSMKNQKFQCKLDQFVFSFFMVNGNDIARRV